MKGSTSKEDISKKEGKELTARRKCFEYFFFTNLVLHLYFLLYFI